MKGPVYIGETSLLGEKWLQALFDRYLPARSLEMLGDASKKGCKIDLFVLGLVLV